MEREDTRDDDVAYLVVRSEVREEGDRRSFDHWYSTDHMPKGIASMGAIKAWRFWSTRDPSMHYAVYCCTRQYLEQWERNRNDPTPGVRGPLVREFDQAWPQVIRSSEILSMQERLF